MGEPDLLESETSRRRWAGWTGAELSLLSATIIDVTRTLSRQVPPPRGAPFFGLEYPDGDPTPLNDLCTRGIFRKYESVLEIGSALGAAARWWTAHFGCHVVGVEPAAALVLAASRLSSRAGGGGEARFLSAEPCALPFRSRYFTHVWSVEGLENVAAEDPRLVEAFRVLRPGGHAALQRCGPSAGWATHAAAAMRWAGFVEVETRRTSRPSLGETHRLARTRLLRHLEDQTDPLGGRVAARLAELYRNRADRGREIAEVFARRPASSA